MNIVYTGPGLPLAPSADPGDRLLEVVYVRPADRKAMTAWIKEPQHRRPPVSTRRGRRVDIVWRGDPMRVDDDVIGTPDAAATVTVMLEQRGRENHGAAAARHSAAVAGRALNGAPHRQRGSSASALSRSILRRSSLLKPNSPSPFT